MENKEVSEDIVLSYLDSTVLEFDKIVGTEPITSVNILMFTLLLMKTVETYQGLKGKQRKELVLKTIQKYMETHATGSSEGLLALLPSFIDASVSLDRGEIAIKINTEEATACCASLCASLINKNKKK